MPETDLGVERRQKEETRGEMRDETVLVIRMDKGRVVNIDQQMLEALISFVNGVLTTEMAEEVLDGLGRTAEEMQEWVDNARTRPGYGIPWMLLRHLGTEVADIEAATTALGGRATSSSPSTVEAPDVLGNAAVPEGSQGLLEMPLDVSGGASKGDQSDTEETEDKPAGLAQEDGRVEGPEASAGEGAGVGVVRSVKVHGRAVEVDEEMLAALMAYVGELTRTHTPREVERLLGRTSADLEEWTATERGRRGLGVTRALLRHTGTDRADVEAATALLDGRPDSLGMGDAVEGAEEEGSETSGLDAATGEAAEQRELPRRIRDVGGGGQLKPSEPQVDGVEQLQGRDETPPAPTIRRGSSPRVVHVAPMEGEAEWFGEKVEFAMRRWRYLRADWLRRWDSGDKDTPDGLLMREHMLMVELDLIENHNMTLTTGLPWVVESLEWDELTRQEQASWRQRELADVQKVRSAGEKRAAFFAGLGRLVSRPLSILRRRG